MSLHCYDSEDYQHCECWQSGLECCHCDNPRHRPCCIYSEDEDTDDIAPAYKELYVGAWKRRG